MTLPNVLVDNDGLVRSAFVCVVLDAVCLNKDA